MAQSSVTLLRTAYPLYSVNMVGDQYLMISGGGGAAKTGVLNTIEIYKIINEKGSCSLMNILSQDMGRSAPMNVSIAECKKTFYAAVGLDDKCALYYLKYKSSEGTGNNGIPNLRRRKISQTKKNASRGGGGEGGGDLSEYDFIQQKCVKSDDKGYQKCVAIAPNGSMMCTGGVDGYLRIWKMPEVELSFKLPAHTNEIDDMCIHPITNEIVTISKDGHSYIWSGTFGKKICEFIWKGSNKKYRFRNCRFGKVADCTDVNSPKHYALFTTHLPAIQPAKNDQSFVTKWVYNGNRYEKEINIPVDLELPSALALVDNGIYLGLGYLSGKVTVHVAYSLQKIYQVKNSHSIFVTGLQFAPATQQSRAITGNHDFTLFSIAADNQLKIHQSSRSLYNPLWSIFIGFIVIYLLFWLISYYGF